MGKIQLFYPLVLITLLGAFLVTVRATEPFPDDLPDISGTWISGDGRTLEITQVGTMFEWLDKSNNQKGLGIIKNEALEVTWQDDYGTHTSTWKIASVDSKGKPTSIVWANGRAFVRTTGVQEKPESKEKRPQQEEKPEAKQPEEQPSPKTEEKAPEKKIHDISGAWGSNIGFKYKVTQNGPQFEWIDSNSVKGSGTISGETLETKWTDQLGPHTATGFLELDAAGKPTKISWSNGVVFIRMVVDKTGLEYVYIPPGKFTMGCPAEIGSGNEQPPHSVVLSKGYWISTTEVTVKTFKKFCLEKGWKMPPAPDFNPSWKLENHPIVGVTWEEARVFCEWVGGRLPTEAEWEYAARAGTATKFYWGDKINDDYVWYKDNSGGKTNPVGRKKPNSLGLYDMSGNVYEWCSDWFGTYMGGEQKDPMGPQSGTVRVIRGGCYYWQYGFPSDVQSASRNSVYPDERHLTVGFRVVRDVK